MHQTVFGIYFSSTNPERFSCVHMLLVRNTVVYKNGIGLVTEFNYEVYELRLQVLNYFEVRLRVKDPFVDEQMKKKNNDRSY